MGCELIARTSGGTSRTGGYGSRGNQLCQSLETLVKCSVRGVSVWGLFWEEVRRVVEF